MESLPEIDVVNSNPSELLATPLNITIQQNVNEDNNSSSNSQDPVENIPIEQVDHVNTRSQKRKYPDITADKPFMESGACPPFRKPIKQDEDRDCELIPILSSKQFTFQSQLTSFIYDSKPYKPCIKSAPKHLFQEKWENDQCFFEKKTILLRSGLLDKGI